MLYLMTVRTCIFLVFIVNISGLSAQINRHGIPEIVNYPPEVTQGSEQNWAIVQDNRGIIYVGNDDKGVLEYDGSSWRTIPVFNESIVRSLDCSTGGTVYVGAVSELGYLAPDASGDMKYNSLLYLLDSTGRNFSDVWKTYCVDDKVYFHTQQYVLIYSQEQDTIHVIQNEKHVLFGFFENGNYYAGGFSKGLLELQGDTVMVVAKGGEFYKGKDIFGLTSYDEEHLLIGTTGDGLSLYNTTTGQVDSLFASRETNRFLNENFLHNLRRLSSGDFIAATRAGGVAIITREGELSEIVSKNQGLQDQMIFNTYQPDTNYPFSHVWTAMSIGVGKISFNSALRQFTEKSGFQGLIHTINSIGDVLFIGTSNGIYRLSADKNIASFVKTGNTSRTVWDLEKFTLQSGEDVLLAIGEEGLMQIHKNGRVIDLKNHFSDDIKEEDKVFWGYCLLRDPFQPNRVYLGRESSINSLLYSNGRWSLEFSIDQLKDEIRSLAMIEKDKLWFGSALTGLGYITPLNESATKNVFSEKDGLPAAAGNSVFNLGGEIVIGTRQGVYNIFDRQDSLNFTADSLINKFLPEGKNAIRSLYKDSSSNLWISFENSTLGWMIALLEGSKEEGWKITTKPFHSLENFSTDAFHSFSEGNVWFCRMNILYHYDNTVEFEGGEFRALLRQVTVDDNTVIFNGAHPLKTNNEKYKLGSRQAPQMIPEISYTDNNIEFRWSAPYFEAEDKLVYSYYLEGFSKGWSEWSNVLYQDFTNLPQGSYSLRVKARNIFRDESLEDSFSFVILRPWYLTFIAFVFYVIAALVIVYIIIVLYTRRLKNENIRLEGIIQERTAEIRKQKEELTDSIEYASRIQRALLPPDQMLTNHGMDHFILFKPRDIVSGDFYWFGANNGKVFVVAADCTGHGVPGAFMSMLGISFLEEIVVKSGITETNKILDALRNHVITSLRQTGKSMDESTKDGMDLAMIAIDESTKSIQYSGAYNPLYVVRKLNVSEKKRIASGETLDIDRGTIHNDTHILYQVRADHMPIGISEKEHRFTSKFIEEQEAVIYLFSDGYVDQFGGPLGKKYMSRNYKKLLLGMYDLPMEEQKKRLDEELVSWMGDISQIDDILVIGIKIKI
jgi:serine phosphatase RsbU (regulator of sigma subunit)/ligand-binding sensor domain-containing protein